MAARITAVLGKQPPRHELSLLLGGELDLLADSDLSAPVAIVGSGSRQMQLPIDQRPPAP